MITNTEIMYWHKNSDWYEVDDSYEYIYILRDDAPERAKKSYEMWLEYQESN